MAVDMDRVEAPAMLRALAEPVRWQIVSLLACEELCVCHLSEDLGLPQPLISHHLRTLREAGLVVGERFRYWTYYRLRAEAIDALAGELTSLSTCCPEPAEHRRPCC
jgi:ArsR family transcriptional regulator